VGVNPSEIIGHKSQQGIASYDELDIDDHVYISSYDKNIQLSVAGNCVYLVAQDMASLLYLRNIQ